MVKYVVRRLLQMLLVLFGTTLILFITLFVVPGDPVGSLAGKSERARDPAVRQVLVHRYGLDKPLPEQYLRYVGRMARGDLGESFRLRRPVNDVLMPKVANTFKLAVLALIFEIGIGLAAGLISAVFRYSFWDVAVTFTTTLAIGFPTFVSGLLLQDVFALRLGWLPIFAGGEGGLEGYILPAVALALVSSALVARLMRGTMLEVLRADYIRTATAKGLSRRAVILKHALRNSIIPVVTFLGIDFAALLGGALITETIFNIDGVGNALVTAITAQDNPIVIAVVTYGVVVYVLLNLIVDIAYAYLDPRIRLE